MDVESLRDSTVLVTGANGFIGTHLVSKLTLYGANVIAVGRVGGDGIHGADVSDLSSVAKCFELSQKLYDKPVQYIFHLAGQKSSGISRKFPFETLGENFQSTLNILETARTKADIKKIVLVSSLSVYSSQHESGQRLLNELDPLGADSVYSATKIITEIAGLSYWEDFGVDVTIARLANVYGPGQSELAVIPFLISKMAYSNDISMGNTESIRDFIFVEDVVDCLITMAISDKTTGIAFNVGTGEGTSINSVVQELSNILNYTGNICLDPVKLREKESQFVVANVERVKEVTGWFPRINLREGLLKMLTNKL